MWDLPLLSVTDVGFTTLKCRSWQQDSGAGQTQSKLFLCEEILQRPRSDVLAAWLGWTLLSLLWFSRIWL